jgi:ABC-2 type transport system ATP-binding protein
MIAARHLSRTFGDRSAVEDVTFDVRAGEIFGLLGPNGAGKTTTLRMLAGLIAPTNGEASVAGVPLTSRTIDRVRQHVGFLTETPGLWERLSVRTNLLTYARLHQVKDPAGTVRRALERFGLSDRAESMAVAGADAAPQSACGAARRTDLGPRSAQRAAGSRHGARAPRARPRRHHLHAQSR